MLKSSYLLQTIGYEIGSVQSQQIYSKYLNFSTKFKFWTFVYYINPMNLSDDFCDEQPLCSMLVNTDIKYFMFYITNE